jgi:hypothetical protein
MANGLVGAAGSVPDVIQAIYTIAESLRAGKAFVVNSCIFAIPVPPGPAEQAKKKERGSANAVSKVAPEPDTERHAQPILRVIKGRKTVAEISLRELVLPERIVGMIEVSKIDVDFDWSSNSIIVDLAATEAGEIKKPEPAGPYGSVALSVRGFANPGGLGFAYFAAGIEVDAFGEGDYAQLRRRIVYISQSPSPSELKNVEASVFGASAPTPAHAIITVSSSQDQRTIEVGLG